MFSLQNKHFIVDGKQRNQVKKRLVKYFACCTTLLKPLEPLVTNANVLSLKG
jgi:hypothetical protein